MTILRQVTSDVISDKECFYSLNYTGYCYCIIAYPPEAIPLSYTTTPTTPTPATATPNPALATFTCNFDSSLCQFTQSKSDEFDWTWASGKTSSSNTGTLTL